MRKPALIFCCDDVLRSPNDRHSKFMEDCNWYDVVWRHDNQYFQKSLPFVSNFPIIIATTCYTSSFLACGVFDCLCPASFYVNVLLHVQVFMEIWTPQAKLDEYMFKSAFLICS